MHLVTTRESHRSWKRSPIQHRGLPVEVEESAPPVQVLQRVGPLQLRVRPLRQLDQLLHGEVGGGGDRPGQAVAHGQGVAAEKRNERIGEMT